MLSISRILLPVDFSDRCMGMLQYAKAVAARYEAELILLHVANPIYEVPPTGLSGPVFIPVPQKIITKQGAELEQFGADQLQGIKVRRVLYEGNPEEQIVEFAKSEKVDLIAMTTHGFGFFRQFLIGSVAAKVLHDVGCAVLTGVHMEEQPEADPAKFSKILCAIDLGPRSSAILKWASQLAADFGAQFGVVYAVPPLAPGGDIDWRRPEVTNMAREDVETLLSAAGLAAATVHIQEGEAAKTVCSFAKEAGADLLVIGRGSRDSTGGIVRQSPCPVISIVATDPPSY
jgi:nucleotide-binding universal stress UspA family protein